MSVLEVDASNACIPLSSKLIRQCPPLPTTIRGERSILDGACGRNNRDRNLLMYPFGKLIVVRDMSATATRGGMDKTFVYRGHTAHVTCCKFSPTGCYVASGDVRGRLRVWSYDNEEHLCKLELNSAMVGPIRDIDWDVDSKRICLVGEADGAGAVCCKVVQWDTGVTCCAEEIGKHLRSRASSCAFKPTRPMRLVTGGSDDARCLFHKGPPFSRLFVPSSNINHEQAHSKGSVFVRYSPSGIFFCSVGTDKALCLHHGTTMHLLDTLPNHHSATIYSCAWTADSTHILTSSADGTIQLTQVVPHSSSSTYSLQLLHTYSPTTITTNNNNNNNNNKVPIGLMQMACAFLQPNDDIVSVTLNGQISVWDKDKLHQPPKQILSGHQAPIVAMALSKHTNIMYTGDSNGIICQWDTTTNTTNGRVQPNTTTTTQDAMHKVHTGTISSMIMMSDDTLLSVGWDDQLHITHQTTEQPTTIPLTSQPNAISIGTSVVVIMTVDGLFVYYRHTLSDFIPLQDYQPTSITVSTDDTHLYVGATNGSIYIYDILISNNDTTTTTVQLKHTMDNVHRGAPVTALQLSHDNTKLASADIRDVCVWDITTTTTTTTNKAIVGKGRWCFHTQRILCITWSKDDTILATGGNDDSIYVWSLKKKSKRVHYPFSHRGGITGLQFIHNSFLLQSVGADACVNQWDMTDHILTKFK